MVEVIVLSDDEADIPFQSSRAPEKSTLAYHSSPPRAVEQRVKRPYKLVLIDSRQCPRMPRPKFLPITLPQEASSMASLDRDGQLSDHSYRQCINLPAEAVASAMEEEDDEDSDYEDEPPLKRRRTGIKKAPKKHGRLTAADWEVVQNGGPNSGPFFPSKAASDRKEARAYVKRLTANVDWDDMLKHLEMLRLSAAQSGQSETKQHMNNARPRRAPSQANRLKQYWQGVLTKSLLKMEVNSASQACGRK